MVSHAGVPGELMDHSRSRFVLHATLGQGFPGSAPRSPQVALVSPPSSGAPNTRSWGRKERGLSLCLSFPGLCRELQAPLPLASPGVPAQAWLLVCGSPLSPTLRLAGEGSLLAPPLAGLPTVLGYPQGAQLPPNPELSPA